MFIDEKAAENEAIVAVERIKLISTIMTASKAITYMYLTYSLGQAI